MPSKTSMPMAKDVEDASHLTLMPGLIEFHSHLMKDHGEEALQAATLHPARAIGLPAGAVEPGMLADLVAVRGNPLQRIGDARNVEAVIANGRLYRLEDLIETNE